MESSAGAQYQLRIIDSPEALMEVEKLQQLVWPGDERDIVPVHMLLAAVHNGGLVIGAYRLKESDSIESSTETEGIQAGHHDAERGMELPLIGFVFGFPGMYSTADGPRLKHCSHMLGVDPKQTNQGIGFALKRAQWQMVRNLGLDRVTWTYDPLMSRNGYLNIARLGAVCNTYIREAYGRMRDGLNVGMPSDRFQVDWWVNSERVSRRMSREARRKLDLAHYLAAGVQILNPSTLGKNGLPRPNGSEEFENVLERIQDGEIGPIVLVEIPNDYLELKSKDLELAYEWRMHTRRIFEDLFELGYLVTDFTTLSGTNPRSFYILSFGESTL